MKSICVLYGVDLLLQLPILVLLLMALPDLGVMAKLHHIIYYLDEEGISEGDENEQSNNRNIFYSKMKNSTRNNRKGIDRTKFYKKWKMQRRNTTNNCEDVLLLERSNEATSGRYVDYLMYSWLSPNKFFP